MILDNIVQALHKKHYDFVCDNPTKTPKFAIYVGIDIYHEIKNNLVGAMPQSQYDFITKGTIYGFKVYRVLDHDFWRIVNISEEN